MGRHTPFFLLEWNTAAVCVCGCIFLFRQGGHYCCCPCCGGDGCAVVAATTSARVVANRAVAAGTRLFLETSPFALGVVVVVAAAVAASHLGHHSALREGWWVG